MQNQTDTFTPFTQSSLSTDQAPLSAIQNEIIDLKKKHNAVVLAHNYQIDSIQQIADYVGDSLGLSYQASKTDADIIVFCGVHFMAETAKIINPNKTVLLPDLDAGCSLSDTCPAEKLKSYLDKNPNTYTVAYINCSAEVKALADVICTSGNAVKIIEQVPKDKEILFVPDQNLGKWVSAQTNREMKLWPGSCHVHVMFSVEAIQKTKMLYPNAPIVVHPECIDAVRDLADEVCSTEKMISFCRMHPANEFIIVTETGMLHRLKREVPGKLFIAGPTDTCACNDCHFMKMNTIEKLRDCLLNKTPEINLPEDIQKRAYLPINRMLEWSL